MRILNKEVWPHKISINYDDPDSTRTKECYQWLEEIVGSYQHEWNVVYFYRQHVDYYFKDERDLVWFTMRWT